MEDQRRVSKWHGRVVKPKLASSTASVLVAAMQARRREAGKRVQAAMVLNPNFSALWRFLTAKNSTVVIANDRQSAYPFVQ